MFSPATCCPTTLQNRSDKEVDTARRTPSMKRFQIPTVVAMEVAVAGLLTSWSGMYVRMFRRNLIPHIQHLIKKTFFHIPATEVGLTWLRQFVLSQHCKRLAYVGASNCTDDKGSKLTRSLRTYLPHDTTSDLKIQNFYS